MLLFLFGFSQQPGRIINCGHEVAVRGRAGLCLPPPPHPNIRQPGEPRSKSLFASEPTSGFPHTEIHISLVDHFPWIFISSYTRYYFLSNVYSWMQSFGADSAQNQFQTIHKFLSVISISLLFWTFFQYFFVLTYCTEITRNILRKIIPSTFCFMIHLNKMNDFFGNTLTTWVDFFAVWYLFNFEIVLLVMVTRVGPLELVIIGLEKASLVTHNGCFPPILFFLQSFSSLLR